MSVETESGFLDMSAERVLQEISLLLTLPRDDVIDGVKLLLKQNNFLRDRVVHLNNEIQSLQSLSPAKSTEVANDAKQSYTPIPSAIFNEARDLYKNEPDSSQGNGGTNEDGCDSATDMEITHFDMVAVELDTIVDRKPKRVSFCDLLHGVKDDGLDNDEAISVGRGKGDGSNKRNDNDIDIEDSVSDGVNASDSGEYSSSDHTSTLQTIHEMESRV